MKPHELRIFAVCLILVLALTAFLFVHNTLYTEGEVEMGGYLFLCLLFIPILGVAMWKPRQGLWAAFLLAAVLLPWQAYENRKWAIIHEEVFAINQFVEKQREVTGAYPDSLAAYAYRKPWVERHLTYRSEKDTYLLIYFMDHSGITYWYDSENGFGYYPD